MPYFSSLKTSKTAVVLKACVTISGTPCPRHITVPFEAEAPSGHAWPRPEQSHLLFFLQNFCVKPCVPGEPRRDPSNRRLNEHGIYIRHCQESNSLPMAPTTVNNARDEQSVPRPNPATFLRDFRLYMTSTWSPSNQFQNCHNCFQGTAPPAAFVPCSNFSKIHTFTITPVLLFHNHICTI